MEDRAPCPASPSEPYSGYPSLSKDFHGTAMLMEMSELCERKAKVIQLLGLCRGKAGLAYGSDERCCLHEGGLLVCPQAELNLRRPYSEVSQTCSQ